MIESELLAENIYLRDAMRVAIQILGWGGGFSFQEANRQARATLEFGLARAATSQPQDEKVGIPTATRQTI